MGDETRHPQVPSWIVDWGAVTWVQVRVQSIINHTTSTPSLIVYKIKKKLVLPMSPGTVRIKIR